MDNNILRENDIRGKYPLQINKDVAYNVGKAFGTYTLSKGISECIIGHDNRLSGDELHDHLIEGMLETGINITDIGLTTTPMFNYSSMELNIPYGVMITASHNPAFDNGFKVFGENFLHLKKEELDIFYDILKTEKYMHGKGNIVKANKKEEYINMLISKGNVKKPLKVVIDTGNGTPSILVKEVFNNIKNLEMTYLNAESDGSFPVHNPDPNDEANLVELKETVLKLKADVGIAFDGDGDRVGIVDEKGNMVPTDTLLGIFASEIIPKTNNKKIIIDIKCSKALEQEITRLGGIPLMLKNGSAYIETMVYETPVLLGGEYSGHVFFKDDFEGYDDGVYAGIRLINMLGNTSKTCSDLYSHINKYYNTPEIRIEVQDDKKWEIIESIKNYALDKYEEVITIDGVRVEYDDGFSLIRASNTGPNITLRFEAKTKEILDLREREFTNLLKYYIDN